MKTWLIEPRDTLMLRDGRLSSDGAPMSTLPFPWPSSLAGLARTRAGLEPDGRFTLKPDEARRIPVCGPWLAELKADGSLNELYFPTPKDAVWYEDESTKALSRYRLAPDAKRPLPLSDLAPGLTPVWPVEALPEGKPSRAPAFLSQSAMLSWLTAPQAKEEGLDAAKLGLPALLKEERVHIATNPETDTAIDGALYSTEGLSFTLPARRRLCLVMGCDEARLEGRKGPALLGGEARMSFLRQDKAAWPAFPADLKPQGQVLRLILLTPALFKNGALPSGEALGGAQIIAACVDRPQHLSGWDFVTRGPKKSRRMAPAGSVYWVKLPDGTDPLRWAKEHWMTCISDDEQDRLDGFGLCLVGVA